jgi:hypothetical protein
MKDVFLLPNCSDFLIHLIFIHFKKSLKKKKNLFLTAVLLLFSFGAIAQTTSFVEKQFPGDAKAAKVAESAIAKNQDNKASASRTTWVANRPGDNWFFSLEGGVNQLVSEGYKNYPFKDNLFPSAGFALGKWFSPVWGLRISGNAGKLEAHQPTHNPNGGWYVGVGSGIRGSVYTFNNPTLVQARNLAAPFTYTGVTLDFLVNLKNLLATYNPKGFFDPVIYAGVGTIRTWGSDDGFAKPILDPFNGPKNGPKGIQNMVAKGGLQLNFRLCDPLQLYLAAEGMVVPENFDRYIGDRTYEGVASVRLGLTYRFNFRHFIKAEFYDQSQIDALMREIDDLRKRKFDCPPVPVCPPCPEPQVIVKEAPAEAELDAVFFVINSNAIREDRKSVV